MARKIKSITFFLPGGQTSHYEIGRGLFLQGVETDKLVESIRVSPKEVTVKISDGEQISFFGVKEYAISRR